MRIALIIIACVLSCSVQAQTVLATDTLTNAGTNNLTTATGYFNGNSGIFAASFVGTKISGTTAGYAIIQASVDGTNFTNLTNTAADSFALTNVSGAQVKNWFIGNTKPNKVRIRVVGSGTQSTQIKAYFIKN